MPTGTQERKEKFIPASPRNVQIEEHWLELPDGRMRYLKAGSGPALILIHGLMGYAFSWRFTIPALAPYATVYAIDNLGAGLSTANEGIDCTVHATAERVLQFVDALGLKISTCWAPPTVAASRSWWPRYAQSDMIHACSA